MQQPIEIMNTSLNGIRNYLKTSQRFFQKLSNYGFFASHVKKQFVFF